MFVLNLSDSSCRADVKNFILGFDISVEKKKKRCFQVSERRNQKEGREEEDKNDGITKKKIVYLHNYYQKIR